jgi:hypothetical protein
MFPPSGKTVYSLEDDCTCYTLPITKDEIEINKKETIEFFETILADATSRDHYFELFEANIPSKTNLKECIYLNFIVYSEYTNKIIEKLDSFKKKDTF